MNIITYVYMNVNINHLALFTCLTVMNSYLTEFSVELLKKEVFEEGCSAGLEKGI